MPDSRPALPRNPFVPPALHHLAAFIHGARWVEYDGPHHRVFTWTGGTVVYVLDIATDLSGKGSASEWPLPGEVFTADAVAQAVRERVNAGY